MTVREIGWIAVSPQNQRSKARYPFHSTLRGTQRDARQAYMDIVRGFGDTRTWKQWYRQGWRIVPVRAEFFIEGRWQ